LTFLPGPSTAGAQTVAEVIYVGGEVVTVNDRQPTAEGLAVKDGKVLAVGTSADVMKLRGAATRVVDLGGMTLLPGFIDPHSHFINSLAVAVQANVSAPPVGPVKDIVDLVRVLQEFQKRQGVPKGALITAYGYDANNLAEGRELTRDDLDPHFPDNPVMVQHVSLHGAVLNSAAMKVFGISAATQTPPGGVIVRKPGSNEPAGLLMEIAFLPIIAALPRPAPAEELARLKAGQMLYAAAGVTTAQEGATHAPDVALLQRGAADGALFIDVVAYPFITDLDAVLENNPPGSFGTYHNRLKLGGVKITVDGSPQGKTAYFSTPYLTGGPNGEKGWRGELTFPQETINAMVKRVYDNKLQLLHHANGDGAIDALLKAHEFAAAGDLSADRRTTAIHSQFVRPDQLDKYARYKIIPSFYTEHTFFFADAHLKNRGREQASFMSPMRAALDRGLRPTNHTDFNVAPIDQMLVVWSAVNRVSRSGEVVGPGQRVTPIEALRAITIDAAYQYFEETSKGSIEPGKLADLVILSGNPLKVAPAGIKDIRVLETIKEGKTIYKADTR
jgi:predicted amidohydrolase YtcJ